MYGGLYFFLQFIWYAIIRTLCIIVLNFSRFVPLKISPRSLTVNFRCRVKSFCQLSNLTYSRNCRSNSVRHSDSSAALMSARLVQIVTPAISVNVTAPSICPEKRRKSELPAERTGALSRLAPRTTGRRNCNRNNFPETFYGTRLARPSHKWTPERTLVYERAGRDE